MLLHVVLFSKNNNKYGEIKMNILKIRNFAIVAHIDHGKSTLADRIMEETHTIDMRDSQDQLLDGLSVEKKHGVTVKSRSVHNEYKADDGQVYALNLIDTPGHVDFNYEVSKSLMAGEGVILLVDATQGVQAQTIANYRLAKKANLTIIPVINKIDSPNAQVQETKNQVMALDNDITQSDFIDISAKSGQGVHEVLEAVVKRIPAPEDNAVAPLKALIFDYEYDLYKGVIAHVRLFDGQIKTGQQLKFMTNNLNFTAKEIGIFGPDRKPTDTLQRGSVGYIVTGIKNPKEVRVGDTVTSQTEGTKDALPGYEPARPMVYAGIYPLGDYKIMSEAIDRIALNDSSLEMVPETSDALGPGYRGGFLGIFHLQIIKERLHDEYGVDVLTTAPNVTYKVHLNERTKDQGDVITVTNPASFPDFSVIDYVEEPMVKAEITTDSQSLGEVMTLAQNFKGEFMDMANEGELIILVYKMPLSEIAYRFFNQLKSVSHGYATLSTEFLAYEMADVVKVNVQINYAQVDALTFVTHQVDAPKQSTTLVHKLKYTVPRRLYPMPAQAIVNGKAIARVDIPPLRKNAAVNGKSYSVSKKQALLRRQSINKRQAAHSDLELPQEVFNSLLELDE